MTDQTTTINEKTTRMLAPHLICAGASDAVEFYKKTLDATEMVRLPEPDWKLTHGAILINGSMVMLVDENKDHGMLGPKSLGGSPVTIHLNVPDIDGAVARALAAGATAKMPVQDMFWRDRYGTIQDPFGHNWSIATPLRAEELAEAAKRALAAHTPGE